MTSSPCSTVLTSWSKVMSVVTSTVNRLSSSTTSSGAPASANRSQRFQASGDGLQLRIQAAQVTLGQRQHGEFPLQARRRPRQKKLRQGLYSEATGAMPGSRVKVSGPPAGPDHTTSGLRAPRRAVPALEQVHRSIFARPSVRG